MSRNRSARVGLRLAAAGLTAFVVLGLVRSAIEVRAMQDAQESLARPVAISIAHDLVNPRLSRADLIAPMSPARTRSLLAFLRSSVLTGPVVGVTIWSAEGRVLLSSTTSGAGKLRPKDLPRAAVRGSVVSAITRLPAPGTSGKAAAGAGPQVVTTYVPLLPAPGAGHASAMAVVAISTTYRGTLDVVGRALGISEVAILLGLGALYLTLLLLWRRTFIDLEGRNAELTWQTELLNERIREERRTVADLKELNRLKEEFVAVTSHELRTPITAILGYLKTLLRPEFETDAGTRREFLQASERQADRLRRLVETLLTTSRITEGIQLQPAPLSFADAVAEVVEALGPASSRVRVDLPASLPSVLTDRTAVQQIVANLVDNALKFSPPDATCTVGARADARDLTFWVQDHGIGISAEETSRIFDRFYQVDSSSTRPYGGLGLGLSLVRDLTAALGGRVKVVSTPGRGSVFQVTLPLRPAGDPNGRRDRGRARSGDGPRVGAGSAHPAP